MPRRTARRPDFARFPPERRCEMVRLLTIVTVPVLLTCLMGPAAAEDPQAEGKEFSRENQGVRLSVSVAPAQIGSAMPVRLKLTNNRQEPISIGHDKNRS